MRGREHRAWAPSPDPTNLNPSAPRHLSSAPIPAPRASDRQHAQRVEELRVQGARKQSTPQELRPQSIESPQFLSPREPETKSSMDSKMSNLWARWLCPSLAPQGSGPWVIPFSYIRQSQKPPPGVAKYLLPLPSNIKDPALITLIFSRLLNSKLLPNSSALALLPSQDSPQKGKWQGPKTGRNFRDGGLADLDGGSAAVRKVLEEGLKILRERLPAHGRVLPLPSAVYNSAPSAVLQVLSTCKVMALQRIRRDLGPMMQWYHQIGVSYAPHLAIPKNILKAPNSASPSEMWRLFRSGTLLCLALGTCCPRDEQNPWDQCDVYGDPRLTEECFSNLEIAFSFMRLLGLPVFWEAEGFLRYPDDDHSFLLIQLFALYQILSDTVPLKRVSLIARDKETEFQDSSRMSKDWSKSNGVTNKKGTWQQSQRGPALPVFVLSLSALDLDNKTGKENEQSNPVDPNLLLQSGDLDTPDFPVAHGPTLGARPSSRSPEFESQEAKGLSSLQAWASTRNQRLSRSQRAQLVEASDPGTKVLTISLDELMQKDKPMEPGRADSKPSPPSYSEVPVQLEFPPEHHGPKGDGTARVHWRVKQLESNSARPTSEEITAQVKLEETVQGLRQEVSSTRRRVHELAESLAPRSAEDSRSLRTERLRSYTALKGSAHNPSPSFTSELQEPQLDAEERRDNFTSEESAEDSFGCQPLDFEETERDEPGQGNDSTIVWSPEQTQTPTSSDLECGGHGPERQGVQLLDLEPQALGTHVIPEGSMEDWETPPLTEEGCRSEDPNSSVHQPLVAPATRALKPDKPSLRGTKGNEESSWSHHTETIQEGTEVVGASLDKSIELLTSPDQAAEDDELMMAVVLMHRVITTPKVLLAKLISRFLALPHPEGVYGFDHVTEEEGEAMVMRHKVCSIVLVWLRDFYRDFADPDLSHVVKIFLGIQTEHLGDDLLKEFGFINSDINWSSLILVKDVMLRVLENRLALLSIHRQYMEEQEAEKYRDPGSSASLASRSPRPSASSGLIKSYHLLQLDSRDIARHLTVSFSRVFFSISYDEFLRADLLFGDSVGTEEAYTLGSLISGRECGLRAEIGLIESIKASKKVSNWVAATVVSEPDHSKRVQLIIYFLSVADECHQICNFSTMMAIWRGLQSRPVRRLIKTNQEALSSPKALTLYAYISELCSKSDDFRNLHAAMEALQDTPCLPYLYGYLRDIAAIQRNFGPDVIEGRSLNLRKARLLATSVKKIIRHQHWRYDFENLRPVQDYLSDLLILDQVTLAARSAACEP